MLRVRERERKRDRKREERERERGIGGGGELIFCQRRDPLSRPRFSYSFWDRNCLPLNKGAKCYAG